MNTKERVVVVDDHPMFRDRLAQIINHEPDLEVCGEADDVPGAIEILQKSLPGLLIVDISLQGTSGLELIKQCRALSMKIPILVLSMHDESLYAERSLRAGANGYITKRQPAGEVLAAIRRGRAGEVYLSETMTAGVLRTLDFADPAIGAAAPDQEIGITLSGAIQLVASAMPGLLAAAPSRIIVVGSGYGLSPSTAAPVYSASKAGLHGFCKALRRQLAASRVGVTEVLPPLVDTPAVSHRHGRKLSPDALVRQVLRDASRGRDEVLPGSVRWLPLLLRVAPRFTERMVARS